MRNIPRRWRAVYNTATEDDLIRQLYDAKTITRYEKWGWKKAASYLRPLFRNPRLYRYHLAHMAWVKTCPFCKHEWVPRLYKYLSDEERHVYREAHFKPGRLCPKCGRVQTAFRKHPQKEAHPRRCVCRQCMRNLKEKARRKRLKKALGIPRKKSKVSIPAPEISRPLTPEEITREQLKTAPPPKVSCVRCGKTWRTYLLNGEMPKQCPRCHSKKWMGDPGQIPTEDVVISLGPPPKEIIDPTFEALIAEENWAELDKPPQK
jgi:hypothetical protein